MASCNEPGCGGPLHANGLCGKHLMRLRRRGTTAVRPTAEERFWALVNFAGPPAVLRPELGTCWLWGGGHTGGYPIMWAHGRSIRAYTFGWSLAWGQPAPKGLKLEHFACGFIGCVNPAHVRPKVAVANVLGQRNLAAWNARNPACIMGHTFTRPNTIVVPGGRDCRTCRTQVARARRR